MSYNGSVNIISHAPENYQYSYVGGVHVVYIDPLNIKAEAIVNKSAESSGKANYSNSSFISAGKQQEIHIRLALL